MTKHKKHHNSYHIFPNLKNQISHFLLSHFQYHLFVYWQCTFLTITFLCQLQYIHFKLLSFQSMKYRVSNKHKFKCTKKQFQDVTECQCYTFNTYNTFKHKAPSKTSNVSNINKCPKQESAYIQTNYTFQFIAYSHFVSFIPFISFVLFVLKQNRSSFILSQIIQFIQYSC